MTNRKQNARPDFLLEANFFNPYFIFPDRKGEHLIAAGGIGYRGASDPSIDIFDGDGYARDRRSAGIRDYAGKTACDLGACDLSCGGTEQKEEWEKNQAERDILKVLRKGILWR
ncbi:MAG TPA: hypothetical protein VJR23_04510 [Candidatus Acidoferrales bacterium]|nr:hypothetical protein [Candidatus Acidoferrales bacterium]